MRRAVAAGAVAVGLVGGLGLGVATLRADPLAGLVADHSPGHVATDPGRPASCRYRGFAAAPLPDPVCTPGGYDPAVTAATLATTICRPGWTGTVRPPGRETARAAAVARAAYGVPLGGEYDHLISLELGGSNGTANLWPEPGGVPNAKDAVENRLHALVCAHRLDLDAARLRIATDWTTALNGLG